MSVLILWESGESNSSWGECLIQGANTDFDSKQSVPTRRRKRSRQRAEGHDFSLRYENVLGFAP